MASFGPYLPVRRLGAGAFGEVWEVRHQESGGSYALKVLTQLHDPEDRLRFAREAEALGRLDHPNVVRVHAAALEGERPYLVQEFVAGGDLAERLRQGPLAIEEAIRITADVAAGLSAAHAAGILHRDLKPANVLLDGEGRPRLVDFGLARLADASRLTETHAILGTPVYMSPEQARGEQLDERSDVYALGALLFALLTGKAPFTSGGGLLAALAAVVQEVPPLPGELRPGVPAWLDALCARALSKDREARPSSAEELERCLRSESLPEVRPGLTPLVILLGGVLLAALAVAAALRLEETGPSPSRGSSPSGVLPAGTPAPSTPRLTPAASERWPGTNAELVHSKGSVGAWFHGEDLVSLDVDGKAVQWSFVDRKWRGRDLFQLAVPPPRSPLPLGLWPSDSGWTAAVRYQAPQLWTPDQVPVSLPFSATCLAQVGDRIYFSSHKERLLLQEWTPGGGTRRLAEFAPFAKDSRLKITRDYIEGLTVVREDPLQLAVWSQRLLFLWEEDQGPPRIVQDRSGLEGARGLNRNFAIAPGSRRFALGTRGTQIYLGDLESDADWKLLPVPRSYQGPAFFSTIALTFAGEHSLYAVNELRGGSAEVLRWDLRPQEPVLTHRKVGEGRIPISLSRHPAGLLAIGLQGGRIWLLGRDRLAPFTGQVETDQGRKRR